MSDRDRLADRLSTMSADKLVLENQVLEQQSRESALKQQLATTKGQLQSAEETASMLRAQNLHLVSLQGQGQDTAAFGHALFDAGSQHWALYTAGMRPSAAHRVYELWFFPARAGAKPVAGGTFTVDASGNGELTVKVPAGVGTIAVAAVTDEPGPMVAPTGSVWLAGKL